MDKMRVRSTIGDLEEFKESIIWKDIKRELAFWKIGFENELKGLVENSSTTNPSTANVLMHLGDLNGRMKAVEYMLRIPDIFIDNLKAEQETTKEESEDDTAGRT